MKKLAIFAFCAAAAQAAAAISVGGNVRVTEPVDRNLYVAGGEVTVAAPVDGNARIAGGEVKIASGAPIGKNLSVAGGEIEVNARVAGNLNVAGGEVKIDAPVDGNATVAAGSLVLGPNANIAGKLRFRGGNIEQDPAARVAGGIVHTRNHHVGPKYGYWVMTAVWTLGLMLLAALIAGALPGPVKRMEQELRTRPWLASLLGLVALICIPIAAVLVMITIIGIPIGILALMGYAALLIVGYVTTSVVVSGLILAQSRSEAAQRTAWRVGGAVLAMLVIASLARLPIVGGLVCLVALVVGVGAIVAAVVHRNAAASPPAAAA